MPYNKYGNCFMNGWMSITKAGILIETTEDNEGLLCKHATVKNIFPKEGLGCLDVYMLQKLVMKIELLETNIVILPIVANL